MMHNQFWNWDCVKGFWDFGGGMLSLSVLVYILQSNVLPLFHCHEVSS